MDKKRVVALIVIIFVLFFLAAKLLSEDKIFIGFATSSLCSDSDNGQDYYITGIVSAGGVNYEDSCLKNGLITSSCEDGNCVLKEYYCSNEQVISNNFNCEFGCVLGSCRGDIDLQIQTTKKEYGVGEKVRLG